MKFLCFYEVQSSMRQLYHSAQKYMVRKIIVVRLCFTFDVEQYQYTTYALSSLLTIQILHVEIAYVNMMLNIINVF